MLGETHTMVCKITDPGNPEWLYMEWTHESGLDLSGHGSDGNLTLIFDSLCMAGEFTLCSYEYNWPGNWCGGESYDQW